MEAQGFSRYVLVSVVGMMLVSSGQLAVATDGGSDVIRVGTSDDTDYETIQNAIDDASPGQTIVVESGVYREELVIDKEIELVAPDGATLKPPTEAEQSVGITISSKKDVSPEISGFRITGFKYGVKAGDTSGDWIIRNTTIERSGEENVDAENTTGDWEIRNSVIQYSDDDGLDVDGRDATSDWRIVNTTIRHNSGQGIDASETSGSWTISHSVLAYNGFGNLGAANTSGNWVVKNSNIQHSSVGIFTPSSSGNWTVRNTVVANISDAEFESPAEKTGIYAYRSTGNAVVSGVFLSNISGNGINNTGARNVSISDIGWREIGTEVCTVEKQCSPEREKVVSTVPAIETAPETESSDSASSEDFLASIAVLFLGITSTTLFFVVR